MAREKTTPSETQTGFHSTFGKLEGVSSRVIQPSTLTYRERVQLRSKHGFEYGRCAEAEHPLALSGIFNPDVLGLKPRFKSAEHV
jgi:hypothetical protein